MKRIIAPLKSEYADLSHFKVPAKEIEDVLNVLGPKIYTNEMKFSRYSYPWFRAVTQKKMQNITGLRTTEA